MQQRVCQHGTTRDLAAVLVCDLSGSNVDADGDGVTDDVEDGWVAQSATGARAGKRSFGGVL